VIEEIRRSTRALARDLDVRGLMNVQYAVKLEDGRHNVYVFEVNPRASRTVPFVSKATGVPVAKVAAKVMAGFSLIKEAVFPFVKFAGVDIVLGPEMKSTGEVMGVSERFSIAFAKSQLAAGAVLPREGTIFISVADRDKQQIVALAERLERLGFKLLATKGTAAQLRGIGVKVHEIKKIQQGNPNLLDYMLDRNLHLVMNTPSGKGARTDEGRIRAAAVSHGVPCLTTLQAAEAAVRAMEAMRFDPMTVQAVQERFPEYGKVAARR